MTAGVNPQPHYKPDDYHTVVAMTGCSGFVSLAQRLDLCSQAWPSKTRKRHDGEAFWSALCCEVDLRRTDVVTVPRHRLRTPRAGAAWISDHVHSIHPFSFPSQSTDHGFLSERAGSFLMLSILISHKFYCRMTLARQWAARAHITTYPALASHPSLRRSQTARPVLASQEALEWTQ